MNVDKEQALRVQPYRDKNKQLGNANNKINAFPRDEHINWLSSAKFSWKHAYKEYTIGCIQEYLSIGNICIHTYIYAWVTIIGKYAMNLKDNK